jgi:phytoene dehydrogenase-like protein
VKPDIKKSDIAIRIIQGKKVLDRIKSFDEFLRNLNEVYPHKNNEIFWKKIKEIDDKFWKLKKLYFGKYSIKNYALSLNFLSELISTFGFSIFKSATSFIDQYLEDISTEYKNFIDSQLLITVQSSSKDISLLSLALGLSYPFHDVFYANGGMGNLIDIILKDVEVLKKHRIEKILKTTDGYILKSNKEEYFSKNVVLNSTIYNSGELFSDESIKRYYDGFNFSDQSAFVVYLTIDVKNLKKEFLHHYQIILSNTLPNAISKSFFISFSDIDDKKLSKNNTLSVTISTHTKANFWKYMPPKAYDIQKNKTQEFIIGAFLEYFSEIKKEDIKNSFSATSFTFNRYINRYNCGGGVVNFKNILNLPSTNTPFKGLYNIGDTIFSGQGWPGVAIGVDILNRQLNG